MRFLARLPALALLLVVGLAACDSSSADGPLLTAPGPSLATSGSGSESGYEVIDLGGSNASARALNDQGAAVGYTDYRQGSNAVYWTVDAAGAVTGPTEFSGLTSSHETGALDVNELGQAVVMDLTANTGFVYDGLSASPVEVSAPAEAISVGPWSINDGGVVVGSIRSQVDGDTIREPVVWKNPLEPTVSPTTLPPLEGHSGSCQRLYVNDEGLIAGGVVDGTDGSCVPVTWTLEADGSISGPDPIPVETGSEGFSPFDINDAGVLAGVLPGSRAGLRYVATGEVTELPPTGDDARTWAVGINDPTDGGPLRVAGVLDVATNDERAVVWSIGPDGVPSDPVVLPITKWQTSKAAPSAINGIGWVGGQITDTQGRTTTRTAALWRPTSSDDGGDGGGGDCVPRGNGNNCK